MFKKIEFLIVLKLKFYNLKSIGDPGERATTWMRALRWSVKRVHTRRARWTLEPHQMCNAVLSRAKHSRPSQAVEVECRALACNHCCVVLNVANPVAWAPMHQPALHGPRGEPLQGLLLSEGAAPVLQQLEDDRDVHVAHSGVTELLAPG